MKAWIILLAEDWCSDHHPSQVIETLHGRGLSSSIRVGSATEAWKLVFPHVCTQQEAIWLQARIQLPICKAIPRMFISQLLLVPTQQSFQGCCASCVPSFGVFCTVSLWWLPDVRWPWLSLGYNALFCTWYTMACHSIFGGCWHACSSASPCLALSSLCSHVGTLCWSVTNGNSKIASIHMFHHLLVV